MSRRRIVAALLATAVVVTSVIAVAQEEHGDSHKAPTAQAGHGAAQGSHDPAGHEPAGAGHESGHGEEHAAEGHGDAHHGPAAINWTDLSDKHRPAFIALLVNFGLLVGLYYTLGKKPIAEGLKQRRITIGKDIEEASKVLDEAKERAKRYQGDLKNADVNAATAKGAILAASKGEIERSLSDAEERAERMSRDAERLVEQERKQLRQDLLVETIDRSVVEAEKVLQRTVTPEDHARLAEDLLASLAKMPAARSAQGGAS